MWTAENDFSCSTILMCLANVPLGDEDLFLASETSEKRLRIRSSAAVWTLRPRNAREKVSSCFSRVFSPRASSLVSFFSRASTNLCLADLGKLASKNGLGFAPRKNGRIRQLSLSLLSRFFPDFCSRRDGNFLVTSARG